MVVLSRYSLFLLALLTCTLTSAQVEHHVSYRDTMFVKSHEGIYLTFRDSLPDGVWTAYARNSRGFFSRLLHPKVPAFKGYFIAGRKEGTFTYYNTYRRGEVERIENYVHGVLDGRFYLFFAYGRVQTCGMYGNGKREGIWMSYDECWGRNTAGVAVSLKGYYLASETEYSIGEVLWSRRYTCD